MTLRDNTNILSIPSHLDVNVIRLWMPDGSHVFKQIEDDSSYIVAFMYDDIFSFARFFKLNDQTYCSIDFQSISYMDMIQKLIALLEEKF